MSYESPSLETPRLAPHPSVTEIVALGTAYGMATSAAPAANRAALQRALDAVNFLGFGRVYIPAGTYLFDVPVNGRAFTVYARVIIEGAGRDLTVLKVADGQGDYDQIFRPSSLAVDCTGFQLRDITIDQNQTNAVGPATIGGTNSRMVAYIGVGNRVTVTRCRFTDSDTINILSLNGSAMFDVEISHNHFDNVGIGTDHDHSSIYTNCGGALICNNTFKARGSGVASASARTAIETHGGRHRVYGNSIVNYRKGMNITAISPHATDGVIVTGNEIEGCQGGIEIWAYTTPDPSFINGYFGGNTITIDHGAWESIAGVSLTTGIILDPARTAGVSNMRIIGNQIRLRNVVNAVDSTDQESGGIEWRSSNGALVDENLVIEGNTVDGALGACVRVSATVNRCQIKNNILLNGGQSTGAFADDFRSGVIITGVFTDLQIDDNIIDDEQGVPTMQYGIHNAATTITRGFIRDNTVGTVGTRAYHQSGGTAKWCFLRATLPTFATPPVNWMAGSTILAEDTGILYTQTDVATAGAGATWTGFKQLAGSIVWDAGNIANGAGETSADIAVTGAALGDIVTCSANINLAGMTLTGYVSAANTVKLRLHNGTGGAVDLGNATYRVRVFKQ